MHKLKEYKELRRTVFEENLESKYLSEAVREINKIDKLLKVKNNLNPSLYNRNIKIKKLLTKHKNTSNDMKDVLKKEILASVRELDTKPNWFPSKYYLMGKLRSLLDRVDKEGEDLSDVDSTYNQYSFKIICAKRAFKMRTKIVEIKTDVLFKNTIKNDINTIHKILAIERDLIKLYGTLGNTTNNSLDNKLKRINSDLESVVIIHNLYKSINKIEKDKLSLSVEYYKKSNKLIGLIEEYPVLESRNFTKSKTYYKNKIHSFRRLIQVADKDFREGEYVRSRRTLFKISEILNSINYEIKRAERNIKSITYAYLN